MITDERHITREVNGAFYTVDGTHAPDYVLIYFNGQLRVDLVEHYAQDLIDVMDRWVGEGFFCPLIVDIQQAKPGKLNLPGFVRAERAFARRLTRIVLVLDPDQAERPEIKLFTTFVSGIRSDVQTAASVQDAITLLEQ